VQGRRRGDASSGPHRGSAGGVAGAGGADVAGGADAAGIGGAGVAGAGGGDVAGAGAALVAGAGSAGAGAGGVGIPGAGGATGATPTGTGMVTTPAAAGGAGWAAVVSAAGARLARAPGRPCRCTETSVTPGVGGGRSVGLLGPGAVDWPSSGPMMAGSVGRRVHAPAPLATTAAISAARRAVGGMRCDTASGVPAPCGLVRHDEVRCVRRDAAMSRAAAARSSRALEVALQDRR
jgi:hypothetical protein